MHPLPTAAPYPNPRPRAGWPAPENLACDPMCGRTLRPDQVVASCDYIGSTYRFCSKECRDQFVRMPERYIARLAHGL